MKRVTPAPLTHGFAAFFDRCREIGLFAWRFNTGGELVSEEPEREDRVARALTSASICALIGRAITADEPKSGVPFEFNGLRILPIEEIRNRRRSGWGVVLLPTPACFDAPVIRKACEEQGLTPKALQETLRVVDGDLSVIARSLAWSFVDLAKAEQERSVIEGFTEHLTEMYEEIGLVYRLGRSMAGLEQPHDCVEQMCSQIAETMAFPWVAAAFRNCERVVRALAGTTFIAGDNECDRTAFERSAIALAEATKPGNLTLVPGDVESDLHEIVDSQIVVYPITRRNEVVGVLLAGGKLGPDAEVTAYETQLLEAASGFLSVFLDNAALYDEQKSLFMGAIGSLSAAVDAKDRYTHGHSERVAIVGQQIASAMGLSEEECEWIRISGVLHDVGKIGVPERVLTKRGRLSDDEFGQMKMHPSIGHRILKGVPQLERALPGVLHHHERWDGEGYPAGLRGEEIPPMARILALADAFDAMSSSRSYRAALPRKWCLEEIERCAGSQFDPVLARVFMRIDLAAYDRAAERHRELDQASQIAA